MRRQNALIKDKVKTENVKILSCTSIDMGTCMGMRVHHFFEKLWVMEINQLINMFLNIFGHNLCLFLVLKFSNNNKMPENIYEIVIYFYFNLINK